MSRLHLVQEISLVISTTLILAACGTEGPEARQSTPIIAQEVELEEFKPATYRLADETCQRQEGDAGLKISHAWLYRWQLDEIEHDRTNLTNLRMSGSSLVSPAITKTTYDDNFVRECDLAKGVDSACLNKDGNEEGYTVQGGFPLRYCAEEEKYARDTYEGIGLHAAEFVTQAHDAYDVFGGDIELAKVHLSVLPNFITYYDNLHHIRPNEDGKPTKLKVTMTHNAMYLPNLKMVAVLPEKEIERDQLTGFFWESPFVLAHEYGHHIEFQLRDQGEMAPLALTWNPLTHSYDDFDPLYLTGSGKSGYSLLAGTFSEAFADLLAHYAADGHSDSLVGLPCFGTSRDISRDMFGDGTAKTLTTGRVEMLLGGNAPEAGCDEPDFSDIHYHGAMLAHTLDRSFRELVLAAGIEPDSDADYKERYRLALAWMSEASADLDSLVTDDVEAARLYDAAASGLSAAVDEWLPGFTLVPDDSEIDLKSRICDIVAEQWPAVADPPFATDQGCSVE